MREPPAITHRFLPGGQWNGTGEIIMDGALQ